MTYVFVIASADPMGDVRAFVFGNYAVATYGALHRNYIDLWVAFNNMRRMGGKRCFFC